MLHGYGKEKIAAITAIKTVIENGNIISITKNYKNKGYDRYIIVARGIIDNTPTILGAVVKSYPKTNYNNKFYLHEVEMIETDVSSMTAPQLSVDTVNTSASNDIISTSEQKSQEKNSDDEKLSSGMLEQLRYNPEAYTKRLLKNCKIPANEENVKYYSDKLKAITRLHNKGNGSRAEYEFSLDLF